MRTGLFIYNPFSGTQTVPDRLDDILAYGLEKGLTLVPFRLHLSDENRDFLARLMRESWVEFIIAAGGDGTLGTIAQLLLETRPALPMGIIPTGTFNDFAESLSSPLSVWECLDIVAQGVTVSLDVGRVNGKRVFLSTCAAGMFVNVSFSTSSMLKKNIGPLAYYFAALGEIPNIRAFPLRIETESEVVEDNFLLFLLINGTHAAGVTNIYSQARMRDGLMDLLLIRDVPPIDLPALFIELVNRESTEEGRWFRRMKASRFRFEGPDSLLTTQDGEEGVPLPLDVEVLARALTVFTRASEVD